MTKQEKYDTQRQHLTFNFGLGDRAKHPTETTPSTTTSGTHSSEILAPDASQGKVGIRVCMYVLCTV
jgi:hypothetical protein